jgi:uncharacterized protein YhdP
VRTTVKFFAVLVLAGVAAGMLLLWRLSRGPISLDVLTPYIERTLNASDASIHVSVGATQLAWAGWRRGIYLRAQDVRATATDGVVVASIPALALRLALRALLHGQFAFSRIEFLSPVLRLVHEPDGSIDLGVGARVEARHENPLAKDVLNALLSSQPAGTPMAYLRRFEVGDGEVTIEDRASGLVVRAPHIHLDLARVPGGIAATLNGDVTLGDQVISIKSTAHLDAEPRALAAQIAFRGVNPAGVAAQLAAESAASFAQQHADLVKQLAGITMDLDGTVVVSLDAALHLTALHVDLRGSSGSVSIPSLRPQRIDFSGVRLAARFDAAADEAVVENLAVDLGAASLQANAHLTGLSGAAGTLVADATLSGLPVDALARYWPAAAAADARTWLTSNLSRGSVRQAKVHLRGTLGSSLLGASASPAAASHPQQASAPFALSELNGSVAFERLTVRYLQPMPPVTEVSGGGTFTADAWDLHVDTGVVGNLRVGPAIVTISEITGTAPTRIAIAATVDGPLTDALQVLDSQPLTIPKDIGIDPSTVGGDVHAQVGFDFALGGDLGLADLGLDVSARLQGVRIPDAIEKWSVDDGQVEVDVDGTGLDLKGRARLEGTPLDIAWHEAFAADVKERRRVVVKGQIDSTGRAALGFQLPGLDGPVGVDFRLTTPAAGNGRIDLDLDLTPARIDLSDIGIRKAPGATGRAVGTLRLKKDVITAVDPFEVTIPGCELRGRAVRAGHRWNTIDASGTLGAVGGPPGRFTLGVRPAGGLESFSLTSNDVGALTRAMGWFANGQGGSLEMTGTGDFSGSAHTFETQVEIADVTITKAPVLARILTLASLSGIRRTLLDEGMRFSRISAHVLGDPNTMDITDLVAVGDSMGIAANGSLDLADNTISCAGSLVPAYYGINPVIEKIPLVRDLFSGKHGLGILGIDFSVSGALANPDVSVHPLESLTPDVVGRFKRLFGSAPSANQPPARRKRQ